MKKYVKSNTQTPYTKITDRTIEVVRDALQVIKQTFRDNDIDLPSAWFRVKNFTDLVENEIHNYRGNPED